ncbi:hypothetical protein [Acinetobacter sp.]|uniref:hypothetical protein n=1 Tax=Acinetobacter sp. TaxID=472 RepID=UPI002649AB4E|nr:hypothetical protein [Acinetobacter sp.]MDN5510814.1 hypothetical protein [Acinetobacter sp.]MDN5525852.1 hypothetical protein [Acinetobacter sp.]
MSFHSYSIYAKSWQSAEANPELAPILLMHDSLGSVALWRDFPAQLAAQTKRIVYMRMTGLALGNHPSMTNLWHWILSCLRRPMDLRLCLIILI